MRIYLAAAAAAVCALTFAIPRGVAAAAGGAHVSRTTADCEKLPGTANTGERGGCLTCVRTAGGGKYYFDPAMPAGDKCRPNNPPKR